MKNIYLCLLLGSSMAYAVTTTVAKIAKTGESAVINGYTVPLGGDGNPAVGASWPSPRFITGTGTESNCITDNLTGLIWAQNPTIDFKNGSGALIAQPNYSNTNANLNNLPWESAITAINNMNNASLKLCGHNDWRLPNIKELNSLINLGESNQPTWLKSQGFAGSIISNGYWSSSTESRAGSSSNGWYVNITATPTVNTIGKSSPLYIWPVRNGN